MRIDANRRIYGLQTQPLLEVDDWLLPYRKRWAGRLDALERFLDADAAEAQTAITTITISTASTARTTTKSDRKRKRT